MVSSAPAPIANPASWCPVSMPIANGSTTAAVLRTSTHTGTSGRLVVVKLCSTLARSE
jgi:hypothetical protein